MSNEKIYVGLIEYGYMIAFDEEAWATIKMLARGADKALAGRGDYFIPNPNGWNYFMHEDYSFVLFDMAVDYQPNEEIGRAIYNHDTDAYFAELDREWFEAQHPERQGWVSMWELRLHVNRGFYTLALHSKIDYRTLHEVHIPAQLIQGGE